MPAMTPTLAARCRRADRRRRACAARCFTRCRAARSSSASRSSWSSRFVGAALGAVPPFLRVVDTVAGLGDRGGWSIFAVRLFVLAKRRLLWRVRRKLILSYIFIGFVPALLIVAFFLLCGFLLFYELQLVPGAEPAARARATQARFLAQSGGARDPARRRTRRRGHPRPAAVDRRRAVSGVVDRRRAAARAVRRRGGPAAGVGDARVAAPARGRTSSRRRRCRHGSTAAVFPAWSPTAPPPRRASPERGHASARARASRCPTRRGSRLRGRRRPAGRRRDARSSCASETGVGAARTSSPRRPTSANGAAAARRPRRAPTRTTPRRRRRPGVLSALPTLLEFRDWNTGAHRHAHRDDRSSASASSTSASRRARARSDGSFGQGLLLVLFVIGALFLIIEVDRRSIAGFALAQVDHRFGARAVHRHRARAAGRLHAQDRDHERTTSSASWPDRSTR